MKELMKPGHPRWEEFRERLEGEEGINMIEVDVEGYTFSCYNGFERPLTRALLKKFEGVDVEGSLKYFAENGGHCDCEVLFNVH